MFGSESGLYVINIWNNPDQFIPDILSLVGLWSRYFGSNLNAHILIDVIKFGAIEILYLRMNENCTSFICFFSSRSWPINIEEKNIKVDFSGGSDSGVEQVFQESKIRIRGSNTDQDTLIPDSQLWSTTWTPSRSWLCPCSSPGRTPRTAAWTRLPIERAQILK